jgi:hypothetical protein
MVGLAPVGAATGGCPFIHMRKVGVSILETLGPFWIIGILVNLTLTGLAIWWIIGKMQPYKPERHERAETKKRS